MKKGCFMSTSIKWTTVPINVANNATVDVWQLHISDGKKSSIFPLSNPDNFQQDFSKTYSYTLSGRFPNATLVNVMVDGTVHSSSSPTADGFAKVTGVLL